MQHIPSVVSTYRLLIFEERPLCSDFPFPALQQLCMNNDVTKKLEGREKGRRMDLEKLCNCWMEERTGGKDKSGEWD